MRFAALSYCWGGDQSWKLTNNNTSSTLDSVRWSDLSATVKDVIEVARELSVPYLWVDSVCIAQDDPEEIAQEIDKMSHIY
jgi:hypothetical protein